MDMCVVGKQDSALAQQLAKHLCAPLYSFSHDYFADTESIICIPDAQAVDGKTVFLVYQFFPSNPEAAGERYTCVNHQVLDILFLVRKLKHYRSGRIILVLPYLPYARQEKRVDDCAISPFELALELLHNAGVDDIIVSDVHVKNSRNKILHHISLTDLWATFLQSYFLSQKYNLDDLCVVSPDQGGVDRAHALAVILKANTAFVRKERLEKDQVVMHDVVGDVVGKIVIIVDDILDTGRTAIQACQFVRERGAICVIGCFSHAVLSSGALARLQKSCFDEVFITNTLMFDTKNLPSIVHVVPVALYLVQQIEHFAQYFMYKGSLCKPPHLINYR